MNFRIKINSNIIFTILCLTFISLIFINTDTLQKAIPEDSHSSLELQQVGPLREKPRRIVSQIPSVSYIEIKVSDATTSIPLEGASVVVKDEKSGEDLVTVSTNADGFVNVSNLYVGSFKITVSKTSASPYQSEEIVFDIDVLGEFKQFEVFLVEQRKITGSIETTVVDQLGNPVANALVNFHNYAGAILTSDYTNESGLAVTTTPLNKGTYTVNASAPGFYSKNTSVTLSWYGDYQKIIIVLFPKDTTSATIEIRTKDAMSEDNLSYVNIEIFDSQGISKWTGTTDEDGLVIVSKLDMGNFTITAYFDTYNEVEKEIFLHYPRAYKKVTFSLFPTSSNNGYIEVIAVNQEQTPISGAFVALYDALGQLISSGSTQDDGQHNLTGLAPGSYKLRILEDLHHPYEQEIKIRFNTDKHSVEAILTNVDELGSIYVEFSDINGEIISTVLVKLYNNNGQLLSSQWTEKTIIEFKELQLGSYKLEAAKRGLQLFQCEIDLFQNHNTKISQNLLPSSNAGSFDIQTPLNAFILVHNTKGDLVFSGTSDDSGETIVSGLALGDYSISIFTPKGTQSFTQSINWVGDNQGISWQDMIDISDNSSCIEFTIWDVEIGLMEGARVDVFFQNGILAGYGDTDSSGFVNITGLFLGQYEVVVSKYGYRETVVSKTISYTGQKLLCSLYIYQAKGHIHVYITEIFSGDPYPAYVRYRLDYGGYWGDWSTLVRADTNGYIAFHNIPMGNYNVSVMSGYYENQYQAAYINFDGDFENLHFALTLPGGDGVIDHYALIVAGGDEQRFTHDASLLYNTLWMNYGYSSSDMILLTPHANDPVTGDPVPRSAQTSATSVEWAINQIASMADGDDQVVILWTGHGHYLLNGMTGDIIEGRFQTHDDEIGSTEFDSWVDGIFCNDLFIFLGPCFSGYWIGELNDEPNRAIYTSCRWDENGWATNTHSYWPWGINRALNPNLSASSADDNNNGGVSLYELYEWVDHYVRVTKDANQHPQRFVGNGISYGNDLNRYIGDGTYNAPLAGFGSLYQEISQSDNPSIPLQQNSQLIHPESGLAVVINSGMDQEVSFEIYNSSL
ncbi:MAG: carboxypeptidase regulatory-like domain-containing protein, partial [Candidatus Kariarchaeaceae archaeon]